MVKFGIKRRKRGDAVSLVTTRRLLLSAKAIEFVNGELLGDGHLVSKNKITAVFDYGCKPKKYAKWVHEQLVSFGVDCGKVSPKRNKAGNGKVYLGYRFCSKSYDCLRKIYVKFYPFGKKIVPKDIMLTPVVIRQWYIGDGSLCRRKNRKGDKITLATCGFKVDDVSFLVSKLRRLGFIATRRPSDNTIGISENDTEKFLNFIGPCPKMIESVYSYKWATRKLDPNLEV